MQCVGQRSPCRSSEGQPAVNPVLVPRGRPFPGLPPQVLHHQLVLRVELSLIRGLLRFVDLLPSMQLLLTQKLFPAFVLCVPF